MNAIREYNFVYVEVKFENQIQLLIFTNIIPAYVTMSVQRFVEISQPIEEEMG